METILQIGFFIHLSVDDKAKRILKSNLAYKASLTLPPLFCPVAGQRINPVLSPVYIPPWQYRTKILSGCRYSDIGLKF
jgi:hypothetical protein